MTIYWRYVLAAALFALVGTALLSSVTATGDSDTSVQRDCYLAVDYKVYVNGRCRVSPLGDDTYTLNTWEDEKPERSHFAVVVSYTDGSTLAYWNADANDDKAGDKLGKVRLQNGCWVNTRARICAK